MKTLPFLLLIFFINTQLAAQIISSELLKDTVTLWANAKFQTIVDFKKEIEDENSKYGISRKFEDQHIIYNNEGEVVINYNDFVITTQKVNDNNTFQYFISLTFWDITLNEDVSTTLSMGEVIKIIAFMKKQVNIIKLKNEDIVSFGSFKIIKSSDRYYVSIKDISYGYRLTEFLCNPGRNEFALLLTKLEKSKSIIDQEMKMK